MHKRVCGHVFEMAARVGPIRRSDDNVQSRYFPLTMRWVDESLLHKQKAEGAPMGQRTSSAVVAQLPVAPHT